MRRSLLLVALTIAGLSATPAAARAQSAQRFSLQGSALYASLFGSAYDGFKGGPGFEGQLRYTSPLGWSFGAGFQFTQHSVNGVSEKASLLGPFVEPRYTFELPAYESVAPYLSARVAVLQQRLTVNDVQGTSSGFTANGGGGLLLRLGPRVNLDVGATYGFTNFSAATIVDRVTG